MNGDAEFDEVFLTDVRVPVDGLLGPENAGWMVGMSALTNERGFIGASSISLQRRLDGLRRAAAGARRRCSARSLVDLWIRGTVLWAMGQRQGPVASILGSVAKLGTTELMFDLAMFRADLAGAAAMVESDVTYGLLIGAGRTDRRRHLAGAAQHHRRTHPRPPQGAEG